MSPYPKRRELNKYLLRTVTHTQECSKALDVLPSCFIGLEFHNYALNIFLFINNPMRGINHTRFNDSYYDIHTHISLTKRVWNPRCNL